MARVAGNRCRDMVGRHGHARSALEVTGGTGAGRDPGMIETGSGETGETGMAAVARVRGGNVVARLTEGVPGGVGAVMARRTLAGHDPLRRRMGERRRRERARVMARIA